METKYYEYVGTQEQADKYVDPKPIIGNIYPCDAEIGWYSVSYWAAGSDSISNEWQLVEKEQSTEELIELLNKQAAKEGMTCSVTFDKKPGIEVTRFEVKQEGFLPNSQVSFIVFLGAMEIICKESKIIEAIKTVLEND
jgi:hypothetical protein